MSRKWTESKHVLFPQWKVNRLFLLFAKWAEIEQKVNMFFFYSEKLRLFLLFAKWAESEQKVNMFFFRSEKLTDYFFSLQSEQKLNRK